MLIALTGKNAAGKTEIGKFLEAQGFEYHSLSDALRDAAKEQNIEPTRDNLINLGNDLREQFGPQHLATKINEKIKASQNTKFAIDSVRNPSEIDELRLNKNAVVWGIQAPIETRFERMQKRKRLGDATTIDELKIQEEKENTADANGQQLDTCLDMADLLIDNNESINQLYQKIQTLIEKMPLFLEHMKHIQEMEIITPDEDDENNEDETKGDQQPQDTQ